jgi:hypothetical protein
MKPENWSDEFTYEPVSTYLGFVEHILFSSTPEDLVKHDRHIEEKQVHPHIKIKLLGADHPISGQRGLFASEKIEPSTSLGEYVGEVFLGGGDPEMFPRKDVHCWQAARNGISIQISSHRIANELAFANDYRGIKSAPNTGLHWIIHKGFYHFGYATLCAIESGEEILVDYGSKWSTHLKNKL